MLIGQLKIGEKYGYKLGLQDDYETVEVIEIDLELEPWDIYDVAVKDSNGKVFWVSSDELEELK